MVFHLILPSPSHSLESISFPFLLQTKRLNDGVVMDVSANSTMAHLLLHDGTVLYSDSYLDDGDWNEVETERGVKFLKIAAGSDFFLAATDTNNISFFKPTDDGCDETPTYPDASVKEGKVLDIISIDGSNGFAAALAVVEEN